MSQPDGITYRQGRHGPEPDLSNAQRMPGHGGLYNLVNIRFGKLLVKKIMPYRVGKKRVWECMCDCGVKIQVRHDYLLHTNNPRRHCGCENRGLPTLHPQEYHIWNSMLRRCNVPSHVGYPQYGGKGIRVCPQWADPKTGFEAFLRDVGKRPSKDHSIDRKNPAGNYEPGNVAWATSKHQARNKRNSIYLPHPETGELVPAAEVAEKFFDGSYQKMRAKYIREDKWPTAKGLK